RYVYTTESLYLFRLQCSRDHYEPHSFPTRRSSDLRPRSRASRDLPADHPRRSGLLRAERGRGAGLPRARGRRRLSDRAGERAPSDRKSTRLNSSHVKISYAVFCLKKKKTKNTPIM